MSENTVSAGYTKALADLAVARGAGLAQLLARAGLSPGDIDEPDKRVPFARFKALMRTAKDLLGDPAFALRFGAESRFMEMSIVGLICAASETMGAAFEQMNRYARLVVEVDGHETGDRFAIVRAGDEVWLEDRRRNPNDFPELTESTWTRFISDNARFFPGQPFAKAAHVTHAAPAYRAEYDRLWNVPVVFESGRNALLIDESWIARKLNFQNRYVFGLFSERAETLLKSLLDSKSMQGRIESLLIPILHTGEMSMTEVARRMGLSRATLYRKLKEEGVNYETLLDGLRRKMALHYLDGRKVSVNQTAYLVGFSDPSAFSRAFKRWTGTSPAQRRG